MIPNIETLEPRRLLSVQPLVTLAAQIPNASETDPTGTGIGKFIVRRTGATTSPLVVKAALHVSSSTATSAADFAPLAASVTIPSGRSYAYLNVVPVNDSIAEATETVVAKLLAGPYSIDPKKSSGKIYIQDNDAQVRIDVQRNASEADPSGSGQGKFIIRRTGPTDNALLINYSVRSTSSATRHADFADPGRSLWIPAGRSYAYINLTPVDDAEDENDESVVVGFLNGAYKIHASRRFASMIIADNDDTISGWWNEGWDFRAPLSVEVGSFARTDKPVEHAINFTSLLNGLGTTAPLLDSSIRVIETTADGQTVLDENVPFQFDKAPDYNASANASGTLVVLLTGSTPVDTTRHYHVYFDTAGSFATPSVASRVTTTDNIFDAGQTSVRIQTAVATYFLQKENGGFSSILDAAGNDWLSFSNTPGSGSAGEFRGLPNAVFPGGGFHAGFVNGSTTIISQGPLKTTVESTSSVSRPGGTHTYRMRYEFFPTYVRATVLQADGSYWFLYEGTPGGQIDTNGNDYVVRSDGTRTDITTAWTEPDGLGSQNGEEWLYFGDTASGRYLYLAHNTPDDIHDSYYLMENNMTVFGFGRDNSAGAANGQKLTAENNVFTFGLADGGDFAPASSLINGAYRALTSEIGPAQQR